MANCGSGNSISSLARTNICFCVFLASALVKSWFILIYIWAHIELVYFDLYKGTYSVFRTPALVKGGLSGFSHGTILYFV